mmetsp:Transcript_29763/g.48061  ORF Transcript_29763/g.48061 Transcript_29763/m.48061 type:complete len:538 (-) Transcript_29763:610-2223(-)
MSTKDFVRKGNLGIKNGFPHPFQENVDYGNGAEPKTLTEIQIIHLSGTVREKQRWFEKMYDPEIRRKWTEEAMRSGASEKMVNYVFQELQYFASLRDGAIEPSTVEGCWQSLSAVPEELRLELLQGVSALENVDESLKDWHPHSNQQVLDLVHPSLFCFVSEVSRVLPTPIEDWEKYIGSGKIGAISLPEVAKRKFSSESINYAVSKRYQWLPSEFEIEPTGGVKIHSYINNLHPRHHAGLYSTLALILEKFVPLFNKVLTDLINPPRPNRIKPDPYSWYEEDDNEDEDEDERERTLKPIDIPDFEVPPPQTQNVDINGSSLQVIVKLANIMLTPEKPRYEGGVWHVEGMENEHIVASGIYYYACENITESRLAFRQAVREPDYEQSDDHGVRTVYGLENEGPLCQEVGDVLIRQNLLLCFPNVLQHKVCPFELVDKTRSGWRKILVYWLVDPTKRIVSTATVPPQQKAWFAEELLRIDAFPSLPREIVYRIVDVADWPMSLEAAKRHREALMQERKHFVGKNNELLFERPFSLCEH